MLKRLLNVPERITSRRLAAPAAGRSVQVFSRVRPADVLPIEASGSSSELCTFAVQAHYSFAVTDSDRRPLFAVELDGPMNATPDHGARDARRISCRGVSAWPGCASRPATSIAPRRASFG